MFFSKGKILSKSKKSSYVKIAVAVIVIIAAFVNFFKDYKELEASRKAIAETDGLFSAHYIDIGQGDATLLRSPDGKYMLIDCGPTGNSDYLVKYLSDMGVESLEYLLITHPHDDHYGGATDVLNEFSVENLILHKDFADTYPYDRFISMAKSEGTNVILTEIGDKFKFDKTASFEIIAPEEIDVDDPNESSLCFRVVYGETAFMFTGDAENGTERFMTESANSLKANVLQAGHHGSSTSNSADFVERVDPEYAVISCAEGNSYGHPHKEVVGLFKTLGIKMLVTYEEGDIVFVSDGKTVTYSEDFNGVQKD